MNNKLGTSVKRLLDKRGISARKLAKDTGMSISTVSDILNGRQPSLKNLILISKYFEVSIDSLLGTAPERNITELSAEDFEDMFEGIVKIKISKLKNK